MSSIDTFDVLVHCGTLGRSRQRLLCHQQALVHWYTGTKGCYVTSKQGVGGEWEIKFLESDICERLTPAQSATGHMLSAGQSGPGTHVIIEKHGSLWLSTLT